MEPVHERQPLAISPGELGAHLRWHRARLHLSQEALAEAIGVSAKSIKRWEQNQALPQPYHRERLCHFLGLDPALFLEVLKAEQPQLHAARVPLWHVPFQCNPCFIGREALLQHLHELLTPLPSTAMRQVFALSGLGGIGKTQLALEYAYRHAQDYSALFWIGAETEESMLTDVAAIAALLELPERSEADQNRLLAAFTCWLASQRDWLLILDNLEVGTLGQRLLPPTRHGAVLITTRRQAVGTLAQLLEVERLPTEEGMQLLLKRAYRLESGQEPVLAEEKALARQLTEALGGLPLALDQAGAYLQETGCSLATYLQLYQTAPLRLLSERSAEEPHPASVVRTFGLAYQRLEQRNVGAAALVQVAAYLAPEAIPEQMLIQGAEQLGPEIARLVADPFHYQAAFKEVLAYSLLSRQASAGTVTMHRLVQAVIRELVGEARQRVWAERVVRLVAAAFPDARDYTTWEQCQRLLPHAMACAGHMERWGFCFPEAGGLFNQAGEYLKQRAQYGAALPLVQRGLAIREQALGPVHSDVAQSLNNLAVLFWRQGKYSEAVPLAQRSLSIREQALGPTHPDVAQSLNTLVVLFHALGHATEAIPLVQRGLVIREQALGPTHPDVAQSLNNLADLYLGQRRPAEALPLAQRALSIREQALGPDHPDVAIVLITLADLYHAQGQDVEALPLAQRALVIWEQALGPTHPNVAESLNSLALLYRAQQQYEQAELLYQRALHLQEQVLGPDHLNVAQSLNNLAAIYQDQRRYAEALLSYQRAAKIYERALPDHPNTLAYLEHLAVLLRQMGRTEEASTLEKRVQATHLSTDNR